MDKSESDKCKEDPVYFAEKYLGLELTTWQKQYLKMYRKRNGMYYAGVRNGKRMIENIINTHNKIFK